MAYLADRTSGAFQCVSGPHRPLGAHEAGWGRRPLSLSKHRASRHLLAGARPMEPCPSTSAWLPVRPSAESLLMRSLPTAVPRHRSPRDFSAQLLFQAPTSLLGVLRPPPPVNMASPSEPLRRGGLTL